MEWSIGYKAHLAVDDNGIIVAHHVTGASVHDSQVAIPLMRMADRRCNYLYALMDGGYTSERIETFAHSIGKVPIIDRHADRNGNKKEMEPCKAERYKARTTVERTNSELKERQERYLPDRAFNPDAGYKEDLGKTESRIHSPKDRLIIFFPFQATTTGLPLHAVTCNWLSLLHLLSNENGFMKGWNPIILHIHVLTGVFSFSHFEF